MITELNERSRQIFRFIVDSYLETGAPVGSRTISREAGLELSPASIRNYMADLEDAGLLHAPHISAGRMPTDMGLRLYIDGLMEVGRLSSEERKAIEQSCLGAGLPLDEALNKTTTLLSGLSSCASLVIAPKMENKNVKQVQFVALAPGKVLCILVMENGMVENRMMDAPITLPQSSLRAAEQYLNERLSGRQISEARTAIEEEIRSNQTRLDELTQQLVQNGLAHPGMQSATGHIIVRGQSNLLQDLKAVEDLERARTLLNYLEEQKNMLSLLNSLGSAQGVQIFLGAESQVFDQTGWSMILSPYKDQEEQIIGAIGVIGPTRLDYDRIIPMVDYTSQVMQKLIDNL